MKKVIFIGQAMPRVKRHPTDWPSLNKWLYTIGVTDEDISKHFVYSALVDYFPGSKGSSHLVPTRDQIAAERERLFSTIRDFDPDVIVPIGKLSISYCLGIQTNLLSEIIGKIFTADPYKALRRELIIVPLPHPSGASTWRHQKENMELLEKALVQLKKYIHY